jgi:hypothetical protein
VRCKTSCLLYTHRESEIPQKAMSALPPKADMCGANTNVRFGPEADINPKTILWRYSELIIRLQIERMRLHGGGTDL